jgi:hypothetical protein
MKTSYTNTNTRIHTQADTASFGFAVTPSNISGARKYQMKGVNGQATLILNALVFYTVPSQSDTKLTPPALIVTEMQNWVNAIEHCIK